VGCRAWALRVAARDAATNEKPLIYHEMADYAQRRRLGDTPPVPLFEMDASKPARRRVFLRAQLPFLLGVAFVVTLAAIAHPDQLSSPLLWPGVGLALAASVIAFVLPWERWRPIWLIVVPIIDIAAVALLRGELFEVMPSVGALTIFPILWIAYAYSGRAIVVAILGVVAITSFPFFYEWLMPASAAEWINIVTLPTIFIGVAFVVNVAARILRRNRERLLAAHAAERAASAAEQAALRRALDNELLAGSLLNTVQVGVTFYDAHDRLTVANRLAQELAASVGVVLGTPPFHADDVYAADRVTPIAPEEQIVPRALRGENVSNQLQWMGPADEQRAINFSARRVHRETGERLGVVVAAHDVTDLATALDVREQFLRTVSHELRTPTTNIIGYLDLIGERIDATDRVAHDYLATVLRNVDALMDRVRELRAATSGAVPLAAQWTDAAGLVRGAIDDVADRAEARGMTIEHIGEASAFAEVDPWRLRQAIRELLINAIKFGDPHSAVTLGQSVVGGMCRVSVTNAGAAIGRADQRRVFDRFYRTAHAHQHAIQGFGIGLTMVKDVMSAHDGHVTIVSGDGTTTFALEVPARR
jgi:signal transduction histidine kinase